MDNKFDDLAKALASGLSRRTALWRLGTAVLASVGLSRRAWADGNPAKGNDTCAHWCIANFPPGPERGACISAAAKGEGPCYACGGPKGGPCNTCDGCATGGCGPAVACGNDPTCNCWERQDGTGCFCGYYFSSCSDAPACSTTADCASAGPDWVCVNTCCGSICVPPCGTNVGDSVTDGPRTTLG